MNVIQQLEQEEAQRLAALRKEKVVAVPETGTAEKAGDES